ncbi:hypothetical protein ACWDTR_28315 [Streptomyces sp. NPDC003470]|uniref:hypothetical protein n=1 Tax=unclassified Streptomyces TaxID=2593676 RepID=UPI00364F75F9
MLKWVLDLGVAVLLSGLEVAALAAFVFAEGMKKWARNGGSVPGETRRFLLVLGGGSASSALISWGFFRLDLPVACGTQAVVSALLAALLILGAGTEGARRISRYRYRRRLRRERRRWHGAQHES